jgi:hypothetical protein
MITPDSEANHVQREHRDVWELLPWYVNQTLDSHERSRVEAHLSQCLTCRGEVSLLRRLGRDVRDDKAMADSLERSLASARLRIDRTSQEPAASVGAGLTSLPARLFDGLRKSHPGVRAFIAVQTGALAVLATIYVVGSDPGTGLERGAYRTLSDPPSAGLPLDVEREVFRIRFRADTSEQTLRQTLLDHRLRIIDGPSPTGLYTVALASAYPDRNTLEQTLAGLRHAPAVELAISAAIAPAPR